MWDFISSNILIVTIISAAIINYLTAHLYIVTGHRDEKANIFSYDRKIVIQTLIAWFLIIISEITGGIAQRYFFYKLIEFIYKPDYIQISLLIIVTALPVFFICFVIIYIFGKIVRLYKPFGFSLLFSLIPFCFFALFQFGYISGSLLEFNITFYILLIIYYIYKISVHLQYKHCIKQNSDTNDFRVLSLLCAFTALACGAVLIIPAGLILHADFIVANPAEFNLLAPVASVIIGFLGGFIINCLLQYYAVFELHKKNSEEKASAMFFIDFLTAPYVLLIPIIYYVYMQITVTSKF